MIVEQKNGLGLFRVVVVNIKILLFLNIKSTKT